MTKIRKATYVEAWKIRLEFSTGEVGTMDLADLVARDGAMVLPLRDPEYFRKFFLELGALAWPNGFDLSPNALYRDLHDRGLLEKIRAA